MRPDTFLLAALATAAASLRAASATEPLPPVTTYWHNWTDRNGISHMTRCEIHGFELQSMSKPADPQWQDRQPHGGATVITTVQPPHWNGTWHEDPKVQWIIPLKGTWFVEAMDGTRVELGPGRCVPGRGPEHPPDAQGRKGHLSGNVGDGAVTLMVIQLDIEPTVGEPCQCYSSGGTRIMSMKRPIRGMDHIGITVPDLEAASRFLVEALGAVPLYDNITREKSSFGGQDAEGILGVVPGTRVVAMRMLQLANGPGIELFEMQGPDQRPALRTSDIGIQHFCVYVDDIDAATARFEAAGDEMLTGPNPLLGLEDGQGNKFENGRAPWGITVEFLTSPGPEEYEKSTALRRYKPEPLA